jgi:hypothetical protein
LNQVVVSPLPPLTSSYPAWTDVSHHEGDTRPRRSMNLWVPETSSTSCDQVIFVDQASDASLSCYAVLLKVDWFG